MHRNARFAVLLLTACAPAPSLPVADGGLIAADADGAATDASEVTDAGTVASCAFGPLPGHVSVGAGGRLSLPLSGDLGQVEARAPEGWRVQVLEGPRVELRAPYQAESAVLEPVLRCPGGGRAEARVPLELRPLRWSRIASWAPPAGPAAVLRPNLWIDPEEPDHLLLFGGLGTDFSFRAELWSYAFARQHWDQVGAPLGLRVRGGLAVGRPGRPALLVLDEQVGLGAASGQVLSEVDYGGETPSMSVLAAEAPIEGWYGGAFFYAPNLERYVVACGSAPSGNHCRAVLYDPSTAQWELPEVVGDAPKGRFGFAFAFDEPGQRLVLYSGATDIIGGRYVSDAETWALALGERPFRWRRLHPSGAPTPRVYGCHAMDPAGQRLLTFGGGLDAASLSGALMALDLEAGEERWEAIELSGGPPSRGLCSAVSDPERGRILLGFGDDASGTFSDLWALEL